MKRRIGVGLPFTLGVFFAAAALLLAGTLLAQPGAQDKSAAAQPAQKLSASAIQVERAVIPSDLVIPEDFRDAIYENVILELQKTKKFQQVYRSGDQRAAGVSDLVILKMIPSAYKAGSQKQREVTTVSGGTSVKITVQFSDRSGKVLMEKPVEGKVRFFGENLRATYDFAKKVAAIVTDSF